MAIATRSDLLTKFGSWRRKSGNATYMAEGPDALTIAEARLNRELPAVETDATITGTINSRRIDLSALSIVEPIALFLAQSGYDESEIQLSDDTFPYSSAAGVPTVAAFDGTNLDFNVLLSEAFPFRLRYRQRFALTTLAPTNWLLTNHPDVYLAAVLMWGAGYQEDWANGATWKGILDEAIPSIRNTIAQSKRGTLRVDAMLRSGGGYNIYTDT